MNALGKVLQWLGQAVAKVMVHPAGMGGWLLLNRTMVNYAAKVQPDANSVIIACIRLVQRVFSEAPLIVQEWLPDREEWQNIHQDEVVELLERPNPYYNGTTLFKATLADLMLNGTTYWYKVRAKNGRPVQLWWVPQALVEPVGNPTDPTVFIDHYEYTAGLATLNLVQWRVEDVIQFRDGMDSANPRKGLSPIKGLFREIFTDDEAANMTASLLTNMGVPGVIIAPKTGRIGHDAAERMKAEYQSRFSGDRKGEPLVMEGDVTVTQFGFSPQQMELRSLRGLPEERITAVLGVNAAVVGLGAGLATTKVGATLKEYGEQFFEFTMAPLYREIATELTQQLLRDFRDTRKFRLRFDLSQVRVLAQDEMDREKRLNSMLLSGGITIAEYRRMLGLPVKPEHELYLRPVNVTQVPTGPLKLPAGGTSPESESTSEMAMVPAGSNGRNGHH